MFSKVFKDKNTSPSHKSEDNEASLDTILDTPELKTEFALLVVLCTDAIRKDLSATFQLPQALAPTNPSHNDVSTGHDSAQPVQPQGSKSTGEAEPNVTQTEKIKKELASPDVQELYRAAVTFINSWRVSVLQRLGEVLQVKSDAVREAKEARKQAPMQASPSDDNSPSPLPVPIYTTLTSLSVESRTLLLHSLLLLLLSLENYPSHSRLLLLHLTSSLALPASTLIDRETAVATALLTGVKHLSADEETSRAASSNSKSRKWKVGIATVAGAALIGVTGGLAAPLLAAGVGTVVGGLGLGATAVGGLLGGLAGSSVLVGGLFGAYGGRITGKMMDRYAQEVTDFRFLPVREAREEENPYERQRRLRGLLQSTPTDGGHRLRVAIAVSGWLSDTNDIVRPWTVLAPSLETFALRWEVQALLRLGQSLSDVLKSAAWNYAKYEIVKRTVLGSLAAGLWPLMLLRVAKIVDNPFSVARSRSDKAGAVLADALINKAQGERPVTLIGYSLGARVIFAALQSLAQRKAFGLVESVVMMGSPTPSDAAAWRKIRAVVAGRVVNVYSESDHILGFLYRTSSIQLGVAGLQPVRGVNGIENVDVSSLIDGHTKYRFLTGAILKQIGMQELDDAEIARQESELRVMEKKDMEAKEQSEKEVQDKMTKANGDDVKNADRDAALKEVVDAEAKEMEKKAGLDSPGHEARKSMQIPSMEQLRLDERASSEGQRSSQSLGSRPQSIIRRKPVGQGAKPADDDLPPPKPPRPVVTHSAEVPESPHAVEPPVDKNGAGVQSAQHGGEVDKAKEAGVEERGGRPSTADDDDESLRMVSPDGMMMLAPEPEPESDTEQAPVVSRKQKLYSALD
ncbi:uncharacterized protein J3D65DRAFT_622673 [Phyllosticta citribraziliensis]|uniref:DUF726-domain-containing protein n=1 Tax=Phyllosticta citribraziliensis TaxID=989973 RepID=A0ABR1LU10_9PEZI